MHTLATWKILTCALVLSTALGYAEPEAGFDALNGPNVRVMRHDDGSRTVFTRTPDNLTWIKKKFSPNGVIVMLTVYKMDRNENPLGCKIYDGDKNKLFKVSYGYRKGDGKLVQESMYDARQIRKDPNTGKEIPVQKICYVYNTRGERSAPIIFNLLPGKTFEEVFGVKSSALDTNPFNNSGEANPNAPMYKQ